MVKELTFQTDPRTAAELGSMLRELSRRLKVSETEINHFRIKRRSVDARGKNVKINVTVAVALGDTKQVEALLKPAIFKPVAKDAPVMVIIGAGPAGLFGALKCIEKGIRPIVLERGKDVDSRRLDLAQISREGKINPHSNYCYGEGGAGAFSDGKLFTRSKKRGNIEEVLQLLVQHGASEDILIEAHAHIGSDKLPHIIRNIRKTIESCGGEVRFSTKAERLIIDGDVVKGVETDKGKRITGDAVMLATGHSARDTVRELYRQGVDMESKGIAVGVRLEHPQSLIDSIQYHCKGSRGRYLPPAEYSFVAQSQGRGVYSFCMCPGGVIVPAGTSEGELVVNGMSASGRAGTYANSGMVVEIRPEDFPEYDERGPLGLLDFQEDLEKSVYEKSGKSIVAPAQRMTDFVDGKLTPEDKLPSTSYAPGIQSGDFNTLLPAFISDRLREGFREFGRQRRGFLTSEATMIGLESRTSSPVRIPREKETYAHIRLRGLYPVGEGAGYAGGIVSAARDGMNAVEAFAEKNKRNYRQEA